jgi:hypothetical protein
MAESSASVFGSGLSFFTVSILVLFFSNSPASFVNSISLVGALRANSASRSETRRARVRSLGLITLESSVT